MERRYALLAEAQVRDIAGYNRKLPELVAHWDHEGRLAEVAAAEVARDAAEYGEDGADGTKLSGVAFDENGPRESHGGALDRPERPTKLPYIVVIIAAKARAAGIHLIVATQRPSVDVITGTIKNNFPSRIAFQVTSDVDSRTILDGKGAKQLLGMGDMLHMDRGMQPQRVHGCYVSEDEILEVVKFVKKQARPVYNMDIVRKQDDGSGGEERLESHDPLYDRAVEIVAESQKVSTSMLQRRLNVGYNRAAKIVEAMEEHGVIGPARGTTPREVFVSAA
jgi:S-DNA-T family DNA segregation ATPase FtsK/SpoIIIE